jgi:hypothetical protein
MEFMTPLSASIIEALGQVAGHGVIVVQPDHSVQLFSRYWPRWPSRLGQWMDERWRRLPTGQVRIYFNQPRLSPGFLVLAYAQAGKQATLPTLRLSLNILEEIARRRNMQAIVCQATAVKLNERVMNYFGYDRHAATLGPNHYIKRLAIPGRR